MSGHYIRQCLKTVWRYLILNEIIRLKGVDITYFKSKSVQNSNKSGTKVLTDVNFYMKTGENIGLLGNSGCGKSTLSYVFCGIKSISSGTITCPFDKVALVMQNPESSFDPMWSIGKILREIRLNYLRTHNLALPHKDELEKEFKNWFSKFAIDESKLYNYPNQFSGGELQRIAIICALLRNAEIIIFDEATSMLDVLVQAKVMKLLMEIKEEYNLSYLIISHDIDMVKLLCSRIYKIENGHIKELLKDQEE